MIKKFELTDETYDHHDTTLYRIRALKNFGVIFKGELGGFVEKEDNLSHDGGCWIAQDGKVWGNAYVSEHAKVIGDARVSDNAKVYGFAVVCGHAYVSENSKIYDNAYVGEYSTVGGDAKVWGDTNVHGSASIFGDASREPITISLPAYFVTITDKHIKIGCEFHTIKEWNEFDDRRILEMDGKEALKFWKDHKKLILGLAEANGRSIR